MTQYQRPNQSLSDNCCIPVIIIERMVNHIETQTNQDGLIAPIENEEYNCGGI